MSIDIEEDQVIVDPAVEAGHEIKIREQGTQVRVFNPLDAEPVEFKRALQARSENYDALAMHLRSILVPGKDFGQIHVKKDCKEWGCRNPSHLSGYGLWAPGADKVLGILGLAVSYPDEEDYRHATLKGLLITDVVIKAYIDNGRGQAISEGMGAATRADEKGDLNRTIKKACKRARVDAVMRLPAISALFEDDFLEQVARDARNKNSTTSRQQQVDPKHDTGARLQVFPLGGELAGKRFDEMDDGALDWCLRTFETSKPDIHQAALRVREAKDPNTETDPDTAAAVPAPDHTPPRPVKQETGDSTDWLAEYDREQAFENSRNEEEP